MRGDSGDLRGARAGFTVLLADQRRVLGPDHPETLDTRYELAHLRRRSGDTAGAISDLERLCHDFARVLGRRHSDTRLARNTLAEWRGTPDRPPGATRSPASGHPLLSPDHPGTIPRYEVRLAELERALGPGHPDTLSTRWFLAGLRLRPGDTAGVAAECTRLLQHDLSALGFEDPDLDLLIHTVQLDLFGLNLSTSEVDVPF